MAHPDAQMQRASHALAVKRDEYWGQSKSE